MKTSMMVLMAVVFTAGFVWADMPQNPDTDTQLNLEFRRMELRQKQLDIQQRESEMAFQDKMRQLELGNRQAEIVNRQKPAQGQPGKDWGMRCRHHGLAPLMAFAALINILLAVWICQDNRKRNTGSGIWIVLALLTGVVGTFLYLLARIGDSRKE
jgi:hypothetical protein